MGLDRIPVAEALIDTVAQAVHANYLAAFAPTGPPWPALDEELREANRAQARAMVSKLASVGAVVEPGPPSDFTFTPDQVQRLAQREHRRWVAQKRATGWSYAAVRNNRRKRHPLIIAWAKLPEAEREKDRDAVRNIPAVLAQVGLRVVRRSS